MIRSDISIATLCFVLCAVGCGTFGESNDVDETVAEVRQIPGKAEYAVFGPHRLRAGLAITGLPDGASEETTAAARAGTYNGPVLWTLQGGFTFGTNAHRVSEPQVTVKKSQPEEVDILLTVIPPSEEVAGITITRVPVQTEFTASPQAKFRVRVVENRQ